MPLSLTQTATVRIVANQAITNNLLRLLALSPSVSISGSVAAADLAAGAVTPAATSPGAYFYGALSGTNAYTLTLSPALSAHANGVDVLGKVSNTNTGAAAATLNVNGLGVKNIYHRSGQAVKAGDLVGNDIVRFRYNTSRDSGAGGWDIMEVIPSATIRPASNDTAGTANAQTLVNVPPLTAYASGLLLLVKVGASLTNTGALTLACDGLAARNVRRQDQSALLSQDWVAGLTYLLYDDGTQFIVLGKVPDVAVAAHCRNLVIQSTSTTAATVAADEVVLKTTDGKPLLVSTVSLTMSVSGGVGLNGLETGATRNVSSWYYLWLISDGTNVRGVLEDAGSGDGAAPAGPDLSNGAFAGYVYQGLVGQIRLNATGSGEIVPFVQSDRYVWIAEANVLNTAANAGSTTYVVLAGADATSFRAAVPPNAKSCTGCAGHNETSTGRTSVSACNSDGTANTAGNTIGAVHIVCASTSATYESFGSSGFFHVPVRGGAASRNIQWKCEAAASDQRININGYTF